jgi:hypothetical protein
MYRQLLKTAMYGEILTSTLHKIKRQAVTLLPNLEAV